MIWALLEDLLCLVYGLYLEDRILIALFEPTPSDNTEELVAF
jgi:hypothetical protein